MSYIEQRTDRRVTNWRNGSAGQKSRGEHLRDGILLGWKFAPGGGSEPDNYFPTCGTLPSNPP